MDAEDDDDREMVRASSRSMGLLRALRGGALSEEEDRGWALKGSEWASLALRGLVDISDDDDVAGVRAVCEREGRETRKGETGRERERKREREKERGGRGRVRGRGRGGGG